MRRSVSIVPKESFMTLFLCADIFSALARALPSKDI